MAEARGARWSSAPGLLARPSTMLQPTVQYIAVMIAFTVRAQLRLAQERSPALKVDLLSEEPRWGCPRGSTAVA
jgi:hypothetical protein